MPYKSKEARREGQKRLHRERAAASRKAAMDGLLKTKAPPRKVEEHRFDVKLELPKGVKKKNGKRSRPRGSVYRDRKERETAKNKEKR